MRNNRLSKSVAQSKNLRRKKDKLYYLKFYKIFYKITTVISIKCYVCKEHIVEQSETNTAYFQMFLNYIDWKLKQITILNVMLVYKKKYDRVEWIGLEHLLYKCTELDFFLFSKNVIY